MFRNLKQTGHGFGMLVYKLHAGESFANKLVSEYHAEVEDEEKERILNEFRKPDSRIRCLVSTVAFGMGIDIPDIRLIIHWGESDAVSQYWQEIGRAGRDGQPAEAILYHRQTQLRLCQPDIQACIAQVKAGTCIRRQILKSLTVVGMDKTNTQSDQGHPCACCSYCTSTCPHCTTGDDGV